MARQKKINEEMAEHVKPLIQEREARRERIKAEHAILLEKALAADTERMLRAIFQKFPDAGDSEIANSIGKSRNTVYLWRKDYKAMLGAENAFRDPVAQDAPTIKGQSFKNAGIDFLGFDEGDGVLAIVFGYDGENVQIGYGETVEEAEADELAGRRAGTPNDRPDYMTDDFIKQESDRLGIKVPFAPWREK